LSNNDISREDVFRRLGTLEDSIREHGQKLAGLEIKVDDLMNNDLPHLSSKLDEICTHNKIVEEKINNLILKQETFEKTTTKFMGKFSFKYFIVVVGAVNAVFGLLAYLNII